MSPETGLFLAKARKLLVEAATMLTVDLNEAAARTAYLAGFHAAQALISERLGTAVKTHKGVQTELHRLTKDDPTFSAEYRSFLSQAYNLKAIADYDTGPDAEVSAERAATTLAAANRFVAYLEAILATLKP